MRRTSIALAVAGLFALTASPMLAADGPAAKVADLAWMTGHWSGPMQGGTLEENWLEPTGASIASLVRASNATSTSMIELIVIEEESGSLTLRVQQWNPGFAPRS